MLPAQWESSAIRAGLPGLGRQQTLECVAQLLIERNTAEQSPTLNDLSFVQKDKSQMLNWDGMWHLSSVCFRKCPPRLQGARSKSLFTFFWPMERTRVVCKHNDLRWWSWLWVFWGCFLFILGTNSRLSGSRGSYMIIGVSPLLLYGEWGTVKSWHISTERGTSSAYLLRALHNSNGMRKTSFQWQDQPQCKQPLRIISTHCSIKENILLRFSHTDIK